MTGLFRLDLINQGGVIAEMGASGFAGSILSQVAIGFVRWPWRSRRFSGRHILRIAQKCIDVIKKRYFTT